MQQLNELIGIWNDFVKDGIHTNYIIVVIKEVTVYGSNYTIVSTMFILHVEFSISIVIFEVEYVLFFLFTCIH